MWMIWRGSRSVVIWGMWDLKHDYEWCYSSCGRGTQTLEQTHCKQETDKSDAPNLSYCNWHPIMCVYLRIPDQLDKHGHNAEYWIINLNIGQNISVGSRQRVISVPPASPNGRAESLFCWSKTASIYIFWGKNIRKKYIKLCTFSLQKRKYIMSSCFQEHSRVSQ